MTADSYCKMTLQFCSSAPYSYHPLHSTPCSSFPCIFPSSPQTSPAVQVTESATATCSWPFSLMPDSAYQDSLLCHFLGRRRNSGILVNDLSGSILEIFYKLDFLSAGSRSSLSISRSSLDSQSLSCLPHLSIFAALRLSTLIFPWNPWTLSSIALVWSKWSSDFFHWH